MVFQTRINSLEIKTEEYSIVPASKNFIIEEYNKVIKKASFGLHMNKNEMGN